MTSPEHDTFTTAAPAAPATDRISTTEPQRGPGRTSRTILPLWIAAVSLAVIALTMLVGTIELVHTLRQTQASMVQLQQQLKTGLGGLGGLLGG